MNLWRKLHFSLFYLRRPPWDTGITPPELEEFVRNHPPGRALDLGCGAGTNVIYLAQHGWQAIGVDFVNSAIRQARNRAHQAGVEVTFMVSDVTRLESIHGVFELVLDIGCFHSLSATDKKTYVTNLCKLLAPQGTYLMYGFIKRQDEDGTGLTRLDLELLANSLQLVSKQEGMDGSRTSVWLTYCQSADHPISR